MKITNNSGPSLVLAHDAFTQYGGAERLFEGAQGLFPQSPIYTLAVDQKMESFFKGWNIFPSPLQSIYNFHSKLTHLFVLIPIILKFWKPDTSKVLLSFSSSFIKGLQKEKGTIHINYCHTPTRFLWVDPEHAFKEIPKFLHPIAKVYFGWLRKWDLNAASKVDFFIANSKEVQSRIKVFYGRDSELIYPFIDTIFWKPTREKQNYFLIAGRLQYAKGLETVIQSFNELELELHVVGTGRYEQQLKQMAGKNIHFLGHVTDENLRDEYSGALGFIYPQFEDFGLMPLEAAGCGTATIALAKGGSLETVIPESTGTLLPAIDKQSLKNAVELWDYQKFSPETLSNHARQFSKEIFQQKLMAFIDSHGNDQK